MKGVLLKKSIFYIMFSKKLQKVFHKKGECMKIHQSTKRYALAFIAMMVINGYSQSTITFNVDGANTVIPKEIYGVLMERLGRQWTGQNNSGIFVGTSSSIPNTDGMRKDVIDGFKECGITAAEWPGGCAADGYDWSHNKKPANDVGVDRFIEFCKLTGSEAVIAGKPNGTDAASNLAFCQYIIDSLKYPLKYFKVGNEVWGCGGSKSVSTYIGDYSTNYDKLKDYFATNKVKIVASINYGGDASWINSMLSSLSGKIDGFEVHEYIYFPDSYSSTNPTTTQYWDIVNKAYNGQMMGCQQNIIKTLDVDDPQNHCKIVEDEWGDWLIDTGDSWMQWATLMDALSAGEQLHCFMQYAKRIEVTCLAQAVSCIHSVMNINTSAVMAKTPTFYVYKMYIPHHSNNAKLVPVTASSYQNVNGNVQAVTACATVDDSNTVNISFTNVDMSATRSVNVTLTSSKPSYSVKSAEVITGPAINTGNDFGAAEQVNIKTLDASKYTLTGKTLSVTLPPLSVAMIRLVPPVSVQSGSILKNSKKMFSIDAGSNGTVLINSSVSMSAPVTISLYSIDGRTLINRVSRMFNGSNNTCVLGNNLKSRGVYLVKITGDNVNLTKQVTISK